MNKYWWAIKRVCLIWFSKNFRIFRMLCRGMILHKCKEARKCKRLYLEKEKEFPGAIKQFDYALLVSSEKWHLFIMEIYKSLFTYHK